MSWCDVSDDPRGEWRFRLFGMPVRVKLWFWLVVAILGAQDDTGASLIWIAVCFVSILAHELGHVLAFRFFGDQAEAVLYAFGGLAIPARPRNRGTFEEVVISFAGPAAGLCLAGLTVAAALAASGQVALGFQFVILPTLHGRVSGVNHYWNVVLNDLLYVNFYWSVVNLLPIYPLDGGRAAKALFTAGDPSGGARRAWLVSAIVGAAVAVLGLLSMSLFIAAFFGFMAASSAQMFEQSRRSRPSWR